MTNDEAMLIVRTMRFAAQKFRSNNEELGQDMVEIDEILHPWLHGDKNILQALGPIEDAGHVDGPTFYNLLYIWNLPEMSQVYRLYQACYGGPELPEPNFELLSDLGLSA